MDKFSFSFNTLTEREREEKRENRSGIRLNSFNGLLEFSFIKRSNIRRIKESM